MIPGRSSRNARSAGNAKFIGLLRGSHPREDSPLCRCGLVELQAEHPAIHANSPATTDDKVAAQFGAGALILQNQLKSVRNLPLHQSTPAKGLSKTKTWTPQ